MTVTSSRTIQWIVILLILTAIGGGIYHYFNVRAAKINPSPTTLNTSGLVGYWTFDGADTPWTSSTAATTLDKSGNNNTGTLTSMNRATSPTEGKIGQALNFDGSNDYVNVGVISSNFVSMSLWVNFPSAITAATSCQALTKYGSANDGNNDQETVTLGSCSGLATNETLMILGYTGSFLRTYITDTLSAGWHHIVLRWDTGSSQYKFYVDGVVKTSVAGTQGDTPLTAIDNFAIAYKGSPSSYGYFNGNIDEVRIYNRALSAGGGASLYTMGTATVNASTNALNASGLVGQWSFFGKQTA